MEYEWSPEEWIAHMKYKEKAQHENPLMNLCASVAEGKHINRCADNGTCCKHAHVNMPTEHFLSINICNKFWSIVERVVDDVHDNDLSDDVESQCNYENEFK